MISIIIPIYNGEEFLEKMFSMLEEQTYKDYEIIIINDGSTDNSLEIIKKYASSNDKIRVFSKCNHGVSWSRNYGIKQIRGEFFTFLDCDDYIDKNYLKNLINHFEDSIDIVFCKVEIVDELYRINRVQSIEEGMYTNEEMLQLLLEFKSLNGGPCSKLIRSSLIANETLQFPNIKIYEDLIFNIDLLISNDCKRVYFTNETSYKYVHRKNVGAMASFKKNPSKDVIIAMEYAINCIKGVENYNYLFYRILCQVMIYAVECNFNNDRAFIEETQYFLRRHAFELLFNSYINKNEKILYIIYAISFKIFEKVRDKR